MSKSNCYVNLLHLIEQNANKDYSDINNIVNKWIESNPDFVNADRESLDNMKNLLMSAYVNQQLDYNKILESLRNLIKQGKFDINDFIKSRLIFYFNQDALQKIYSNLSLDLEFSIINDLTKQVVKMSATQYIDSKLASILRTPLTPKQQNDIYNNWSLGELSSDLLYTNIKDNVYDKTKLTFLSKIIVKTLDLIDKSALDSFKHDLLKVRSKSEIIKNTINSSVKVATGIIKTFDQLKSALGIDELIKNKQDLQNKLIDLNNQLKAGQITIDEFNKQSDVINKKLEVIGRTLFNATTVMNNSKIIKNILKTLSNDDINNISSLLNISNMLNLNTETIITELISLINSCVSNDNVMLINNTDPTNPAIAIIKYLHEVNLTYTTDDIVNTITSDINKYLKIALSSVSIIQLKQKISDYLKKNKQAFGIKNRQLNSKIKDELKIPETAQQANKISTLASTKLFNVKLISTDDLNTFVKNIKRILGTEFTTDQQKKLIDGILNIYSISIKTPMLYTNPKIDQTNIFNNNVIKNIIIYLNTKSDGLIPDILKNKNSLLLAVILHYQQGINQPFSLSSIITKFNMDADLKNLGVTDIMLNNIIINNNLPVNKYITAKFISDKTNTSDIYNTAINIAKLAENNVSASDFLISRELHDQKIKLDKIELDALNHKTTEELNSLSQGPESTLVLNKDYYKLIGNSIQWEMLVNKLPTTGIPDDVLNSTKKKYLFKLKDKTTPIILKSGVVAMYINNILVRAIVHKGDTAEQVVDALNVAYSEAANTTEAPVVLTDHAVIILGDPTDINPQLTAYSDGVLNTDIIQTQSSIVEFDQDQNKPNLIYPGKIKLNRYKIAIPQTNDFVSSSGEAVINYNYDGSEYPYFYHTDSTAADFISDLNTQFGDAITKRTSKFFVITTPKDLTITKSGFKEGVGDLTNLPPVNNTPLTIPTTFSSDDTIDPDETVSEDTKLTATIDKVDVPINIPKGITYAEALKLINDALLKLGINVTVNINPDNTVTVASSDQNDDIKFKSNNDDNEIIPKVNPDPISNEDILSTESMKEYLAKPPVSDDKSISSFSQYTGTTLTDPGNFQTPDSTFPHLPDAANAELNNKINDILNDSSLTPEGQAIAINKMLDQNDNTQSNTNDIPQEVPKSETPDSNVKDRVENKIKNAKKKWNKFERELETNRHVTRLNRDFQYLANPPKVTDEEVAESNVENYTDEETRNEINAQLRALGVFTKPFPPKGDYDTTDYLAPGYVPPTKLDKYQSKLNNIGNFSIKKYEASLIDKANSHLPPWARASLDKNGNITLKAGYTLDLTKNPVYQRLNKLMNMNLNKIAQAYINEQLLIFNQILTAMLLDFETQFAAGLKPFFDLFKSINSILDIALKGLKKPKASRCNFGFSLPGLNFDLSFLIKYFPFHLPFLDLEALIASIIKAIIQAFKNMVNTILSALKYVWVMLKLLVKTAIDLLAKAYKAIVKALGLLTCDIIATISNVLTIIIAAIRLVKAITTFMNSVKAPKIKLDPAKIAAKVKQAHKKATTRV